MKKLILICALLFAGSSFAQVLEQDSLALVAFYNSTGGSNWNNNTNWLTGPVSSWHGVIVENGRAIEITLYQNNLNGIIPYEIGNLIKLRKLKIGHDKGLTGEIPESIGNLTQLEVLVICNCDIQGSITNSICSCSILKSLHLWENHLTGAIPSEVGNLDSLEHLDLHDNQLTGSIPPELGSCTNLQELRLFNNQLTGTIPEEITLLPNISYLDLHSNLLSGELPTYLSNMFNPQSEEINIGDNMFSGPVPQQWGNISFLTDGLNLSYNRLTSLPTDCSWAITFFHIEGNKLTFEYIEPHYQAYQHGHYWFFYYEPQDHLLTKIDTAIIPASSYSIYSGTNGEFTNYKWYKNGELILESTEADTLYLKNISCTDTGVYTCKAENSLIYHLKLYRKPVHITLDTATHAMDIKKQDRIIVYPNPANEIITIENIEHAGAVGMKILDMQGKCVFNREYKNLTNSSIKPDITALANGIYLINIKTQNDNYTTKFIKNRQGINR